MLRNKLSGFTLVEMLVVVAIMVTAATYFTNFFINRLTHEEVRSFANDMITLNRAITGFYSEHYRWPGQTNLDSDNQSCSVGDFFDELQPEFVMGYDNSDYLIDCQFSFKMEFSRRMPSREIADILAAYLPSAQAYEVGSDSYVRYVVIRPRLPMKVRFFDVPGDSEGMGQFPFPDDCPEDQASISVMPDRVCAPPPHANAPNIVNYNLLGGFKLRVEDYGPSQCDDEERRCWKFWVRARSDGASSGYDTIRFCPPENNEPITFRGMVFCSRD